jgi:hypothetical protein
MDVLLVQGCSGHRRTVKLILSGDVETCFVSSFFDTSDDVNINDDLPCHTDVNIEDDQNNNIFDELKDVRRKHPHSFQCAYLNINSFRNKYCSIKELLNENLVDMIFYC